MIRVIKDLDDKMRQEEIVVLISRYYEEVREILPKLQVNIQIYFDNFCLVKEWGVGGYAYSPEIITIAFDTTFKDKEYQKKALRDTVFHESYHIAQDYHGAMGDISAIEVAVYEGAASVFERDVSRTRDTFVSYDNAKAQTWYEELKGLSADYDWYAWKVYDEADGEKYKSYKTGAYIVDQAINKSGKSIIELNALKATEILQLADL